MKKICSCGYAMIPLYNWKEDKYYLECPVCRKRIYPINQEERNRFKLYYSKMLYADI